MTSTPRSAGTCAANAKEFIMRLLSPLHRVVFRSAAVLVGLLAASNPGAAQGLKELYELARNHDAAYLGARAQAIAAGYNMEQIKAQRWPTVNLTANSQYDDIRNGSAQRLGSTNHQASVDAEQLLFNRSTSTAIAQAEKQAVVSEADLQAAEQDLMVRLAQAYFDVLAALDAQATVQANKKAIAEQLNSAKRNFDAGSSTITDWREAQARYDITTAQEIAADNELYLKRIALDQLVGRGGVTPQALKVPVLLPALVPDKPDDWLKLVDTAPAVRRAQLVHEVAKLETHKARVAGWPTLRLTGSLSVNRANDLDSLSVNGNGNVATGSIGIALQMPLYSGGVISNRQKETVALEDQSRNALDAARRLAAAGTRQAFFGVRAGLAQVKALEAAEVSSKLALEATKLGYRVGARVNLDVLNAQAQLFTTQRDLARTRYDVILGNLTLRQASGVLSASDLEATSLLLSK